MDICTGLRASWNEFCNESPCHVWAFYRTVSEGVEFTYEVHVCWSVPRVVPEVAGVGKSRSSLVLLVYELEAGGEVLAVIRPSVVYGFVFVF